MISELFVRCVERAYVFVCCGALSVQVMHSEHGKAWTWTLRRRVCVAAGYAGLSLVAYVAVVWGGQAEWTHVAMLAALDTMLMVMYASATHGIQSHEVHMH